MSVADTRRAAIYARLRARFPTFRIAVEVFDCGGTPKGAVATTGTLLHWEMPSERGRRGYVRGRSTSADADGLDRALREAWRECRRWRP